MARTWSDRKTAATLLGATVLVVWGLITHGTYAGSGDEVHYLMIARSLAFDGDAHLGNDYADPSNLIGGGTVEPGLHLRSGRNGIPRPVHDIGLPLLAAPFVRLFYPLARWIDSSVPRSWMIKAKLNASLLLRHQFSLLMTMVAGFVAIEMWRLLRTAGVGDRPAFWWALLMTLSPPLLSFAFLFFTELVAALIVLICLQRILPGDGRVLVRPSVHWLLTGMLVSLLTLIHIRNGPVSLVLALIAVVVHRRQSSTLWPFAAGIVVVAAVRTAIQWHLWGTLLLNEHARVGSFQSGSGMFREIAVRTSGLFLDQEFGLLALAPIYLLAVPGLVRLWRSRLAIARPLTAVVTVCLLSIVLPMINPYDWTGAWSPAPRFLVPIAPLLAIAAAFGATAVMGVRKLFVATLIGLQLTIDIVVWNQPKLLWDLPDGVSTVPQAMPVLQALYAKLPAWHGPAASVWPFVAAAAAWAALSIWLLGAYKPRRVEQPA